MASTIDWLTTLPESFQQNSYVRGKQGNVVRTTMSTGRPQVRRRFTAISLFHSGNMVMTDSQLTDFEDFFDNTIISGTLTFNFPDPRNLTQNIEVRFVIENEGEPYTVTPWDDTQDWQVGFQLEQLP